MLRLMPLALVLALVTLPAAGKEGDPSARFTLRAPAETAPPPEPSSRFRLTPGSVSASEEPREPRFALLSLPLTKGGEACAPADSLFRDGFEN